MLCLFANATWSQPSEEKSSVCDTIVVDRAADNFVIASLLICEPSSERFYSVFGHASIRLQCPTFDLDYVFTYSSENLDEAFLYLAGKRMMGLMEVPTDSFIAGEFRGIREYPMQLPPQVKTELWRVFDTHAMEGSVPYDCVRGSCARMIYSYLTEAIASVDSIRVEGPVWSEDFEMTIRELNHKYTYESPWNGVLYSAIVGFPYIDKVDLPNAEKLVYPKLLVDVLQTTTINDVPILGSQYEMLRVKPQIQRGWFTPIVCGIIILLLSLLSFAAPFVHNAKLTRLAEVWDIILLVVVTVIGTLMSYLVLFSHLPHTEWNWLIVPYNLLPAILWHWRRHWTLPYSILLIIWVIAMSVYPHQMVEPIHLLFAISFALILIKNSNIYEKYVKKYENYY